MKENIHSADLCIVKAFRMLLDKWLQSGGGRAPHLHQPKIPAAAGVGNGAGRGGSPRYPRAMGTGMTQLER